MNRRQFFRSVTGFSLLSLLNVQKLFPEVENQKLIPTYSGKNNISPLKFEPKNMIGISERMILSHYNNNYSGAVKRLNQIEERLRELILKPDFKPFELGALKREEFIATNSMILHELYFDNLGGKRTDSLENSALKKGIESSFGSFELWKKEFKNIALSLAGGSGWVVLYYNYRTRQIGNFWCQDHTFGLVNATPILVLDMYEHSYHIDFGANAKEYIEVFFQNIRWDIVEERFRNCISRNT